MDGRSLVSTELGRLVNDKLKNHFADLMDTEFTSRIEDQLDQIEEHETDWKSVLQEFYSRFQADLEDAEEEMSSEKGREPEEEITCDECGEPMVIRWNKNGKFLGCSAFPECDNTRSFDTPDSLGEECPECGEDLIVKRGSSGQFIGCSAYPDCEYTRSLDYLRAEDGSWYKMHIDCEECDGKLVIRTSGGGQRFLGCTGFPDCRNTKQYPDRNKVDEWIEEGLLTPVDLEQPEEPAIAAGEA
jgi:DNA topoisomerase-1